MLGTERAADRRLPGRPCRVRRCAQDDVRAGAVYSRGTGDLHLHGIPSRQAAALDGSVVQRQRSLSAPAWEAQAFLHGCQRLANSTATIPIRKMPSNVPAPPIEATGAPNPRIAPRLSKSAPIRVPKL